MIDKRVKRVRLIEPAAVYTVIDAKGVKHVGTFSKIAKLCPTVAKSTLKRRLDCGDRELTALQRAPEPKSGRHLRRNPKPLPRFERKTK